MSCRREIVFRNPDRRKPGVASVPKLKGHPEKCIEDFSFLHGIDPLLDILAWDDPNTPDTSTLAHEILLEIRGQTTFGKRIVPQGEMVQFAAALGAAFLGYRRLTMPNPASTAKSKAEHSELAAL